MPDPFDIPKPMAVCVRGHTYPVMAGACPYCPENAPLADGLDDEGHERFHHPYPPPTYLPLPDGEVVP